MSDLANLERQLIELQYQMAGHNWEITQYPEYWVNYTITPEAHSRWNKIALLRYTNRGKVTEEWAKKQIAMLDLTYGLRVSDSS